MNHPAHLNPPATGSRQPVIRRPGAARRIVAAAAGLLCLGAGLVQAAPPGLSPEGPWAKGRVLVMPKAGLADAELDKIVGEHGGKARRIGGSRLYTVDLPGNASEKSVVARLANHPQLKFAELDRQVQDNLAVNDPYLGSQWHLPKVNAPVAWDSGTGTGVTIAVLDSGVEASHPDLAGRVLPGWNFWDNNADTSDVRGHGTRVAGTAAAGLNNATGVASPAGMAKILPVRVSDATGTTYLSTIAQALTYAADNGARVANVSFSVAGSTAVQSAAQYMKSRNGLVVVSAGNSGVDLGAAPSSSFIVVSATDASDLRASWSNYGNYVHLAAPGVSLYTTTTGATYTSASGTSFSSPLVAGIAALVMSANPALSSTQVESALFSSAVDLGAAGRDVYFGYGRVDAAGAVLAAKSITANIDTLAPSVSIAAPLASSTVSGLAAVSVNASDNVGVSKVELRVNGTLVATDSSSPFAFSWDTRTVANGSATVTATAYDAAGNKATSSPVVVNVSNATAAADTTPPTVAFTSPGSSTVSGSVTVSTSASDNAGAAGIQQKLYVDGALVAQGTGGTLSYKWNTTKVKAGSHTLTTVATDATGNTSSTSLQVTR